MFGEVVVRNLRLLCDTDGYPVPNPSGDGNGLVVYLAVALLKDHCKDNMSSFASAETIQMSSCPLCCDRKLFRVNDDPIILLPVVVVNGKIVNVDVDVFRSCGRSAWSGGLLLILLQRAGSAMRRRLLRRVDGIRTTNGCVLRLDPFIQVGGMLVPYSVLIVIPCTSALSRVEAAYGTCAGIGTECFTASRASNSGLQPE